MIATRCALRKPEPSMLDASTPAPKVASRQRRVVSGAPPATTSPWPSGNWNEPRTTWQALANEPDPPSSATAGRSPTSATPTRSSGPATRSTDSTP